jgi:hypothetical protein
MNTLRDWLLWTIVGVAAVYVACSSARPERSAASDRQMLKAVQAELDGNRKAWAAEGPDDYDLTLQRICFCSDELTQPVVVSVRDGKIVSVRVAATGEPVTPSYAEIYPDVEGLFTIIQDAIDSNAASIHVVYAPSRDVSAWRGGLAPRGLPVWVEIDYERKAYDEEMSYGVHALRPTER